MRPTNNLKKQDSFRHILKSSASICESSDLQLFGTTTGIQSGPDTFAESRFGMTFLTILVVTEIVIVIVTVIVLGNLATGGSRWFQLVPGGSRCF